MLKDLGLLQIHFYINWAMIRMMITCPNFGFDNVIYQGSSHKVIINAPAKQIYQYLSNSKNASEWSSFVSHIIPLNPKITKDGTIGSIRRCFKNKNEKGETWDEEIVINELNQRRRLTIFNLKNFPLNSNGLLTEQLYKTISKNQCQLSFSLFLNEKAGIVDHL